MTLSTKTKSTVVKVLWFVNSGPDASHLVDCRPFERLKDALAYGNLLPKTPIGEIRPYKIERYEYLSSAIYGDLVKTSLVKTVNC